MILADFKHVRLLVTIFPEVLNVYSDALLETQIHRNFLAIMRRLETSVNYPSTKEADWVPLQFMINLVFWAQTRIFPEDMASFDLLLSNNRDNFLLLASGSFDFNSIL